MKPLSKEIQKMLMDIYFWLGLIGLFIILFAANPFVYIPAMLIYVLVVLVREKRNNRTT